MSEKNSITLDFPNRLLKYELKEYLEHNFKVYISKENQDFIVYGKPEDLTLCQEQAEYFKSVDSQCLLLLNEFSMEALNILSLKLFFQSKCKVLYRIELNILYIYGQLHNCTETYNYLCHYNNMLDKDIEFDFSEAKNDSLKLICKELEIKIPSDISVKSKIFIYFILKYRLDLFNRFDESVSNIPSKLTIYPGSIINFKHNLLEKLHIEEPKNLIIEPQNNIPSLLKVESDFGPLKVFRTVIIDGGNVAHEHGNQRFSFMGIKYAIDYFVSRGHKKVYALLSRRWQPFGGEVFEQLECSGYLKYTPSRVINNVRETPHDDCLILDAAVATNGIVLSNDQYREHMVIEKYKNVISNRLIAFTFFEDHIIIPSDPFGPGGPSLDDILVQREEIQLDPITIKTNKNKPPPKFKNGVLSNQIFKQESDLKGKQYKLYQQIIEVFPDHKKLIESIIKANPEIGDVRRIVDLLMMATNNK